MSIVEKIALAALHRVEPEKAHDLALKALKTPFAPLPGPVSTPRLATKIAGLSLPNPVGLAAGFDKNAIAVSELSRAGFGYIELGAATPRPQSGNPKPRLFRLTQDHAVINRFGFNNDGMDAIAARLAARAPGIPVGLNIGANKDSTDRASDFTRVLETSGPHVDFATINVSSPNTEKLRDLQGKDALASLLRDVLQTRDALARPIPIFLKISPDMTDPDLADLAQVALNANIDAIIATNTTLSRYQLVNLQRRERGGLSGAPLFLKSTRFLAHVSQLTQGRIPLIGVGGISSAQQAYDKIRAGASAVQLYTAMIYHGLSLAVRIAKGLDQLLERDGFDNIADAVGTQRDKWL